jgi:hypothetical protein
MLLRRLNTEGGREGGVGPMFLVLGQLCVLVAIVLARLARESGGIGVSLDFPLGDFWQGLLAGLTGTFVVVSISLTLSAIRRRRGWRR